jgi:aminoglycoside phosphotransferase (APT) family kinase protein
MHSDQSPISVDTVGQLLAEQFPDLSPLPLTMIPNEGTVHAIVRVGDGLVARLPIRPGDADEIAATLAEQAVAVTLLAEHTRFATPRPVAIGAPGPGYPLPWALQTWVPGRTARADRPEEGDRFADDFAEFVAEVRAIPTGGRTFNGNGRGGHLPDHDEWVGRCLRESAGLIDTVAAGRLWGALRDLPRHSPDVMTHGDLTPGNVIVAGGRLTGVIDGGGLGPADPALDLVGAWHLLGTNARRHFRATLRCDELDWRRGAAWALVQALGAVWYYVDSNPSMHQMGVCTIERLLADASVQ